MKRSADSSIETSAVQGGEPRHYAYDALTAPIVQTATYSFEKTQDLIAYMDGHREREEYGRYGNPTVRLIENKIAALEGAEDGVAFSSGMAAITTTILALTKAGSHVVLFADCYRRTRQFLGAFLERFGVQHTLVPAADIAALEAAITPQTRLLISEAPTNPYLRVVDLAKVAEVCKARKVKTLIDTTFATPINLRPLDHGIDLVVHSATKYLAGHNDVLAGLVVGNAMLTSLVLDVRHVMGAVCDPHAAYLVLRGMKTVALRMARQNASALYIAKELEQQPRIKQVWYPGLPSHPDHAIASRLMSGFGGVITFELDGTLESTSRFVDALTIPRIAPSLGGVESLVEQPALMSYYELSEAERNQIGIRGTLVRYSVGIEDPHDLLADLLSALMA